MGRKLVITLLVICLVLLGLWWVDHTRQAGKASGLDEIVYDGQAGDLQGTSLVYTPHVKIGSGKNLVWCAAFDLAWQEAQRNLGAGTLGIIGQPELTAQLASEPLARGSLPTDWFYAGFGELPDKMLLPRLTKELQAKFPGAPAPRLPGYNPDFKGFLSLAYLRGAVHFAPPFKEEPRELAFPNREGLPKSVSCFGIDKDTALRYPEVRRHVAVLAAKIGFGVPRGSQPEFVLDLAADNPQLQLILAQVPPAETLQATWEAVRWRIEEANRQRGGPGGGALGMTDTLTVPVLGFRLSDLVTYTLDTPGRPDWQGYEFAFYQQVGFSLTASGALLEATAGIYPLCQPRDFVFDQPFLIALKQRDVDDPFFLMWVANAELMRKR